MTGAFRWMDGALTLVPEPEVIDCGICGVRHLRNENHKWGSYKEPAAVAEAKTVESDAPIESPMRKRGRPRLHASNADRQKAYRHRHSRLGLPNNFSAL